uniref:RNA polymerase sigma factor n=1 Tax=Radiobacillus sp. PE A8.2 TaxID=3380349 RepID=UPI00388F4C7C
ERFIPHLKKWDESLLSFVISEQQIDLNQLLAKLNKQQAETIRLRYFHDLDYQTIAEVTNVSLGTVKSRIHQGLNKLNELYGGEYHE